MFPFFSAVREKNAQPTDGPTRINTFVHSGHVDIDVDFSNKLFLAKKTSQKPHLLQILQIILQSLVFFEHLLMLS